MQAQKYKMQFNLIGPCVIMKKKRRDDSNDYNGTWRC